MHPGVFGGYPLSITPQEDSFTGIGRESNPLQVEMSRQPWRPIQMPHIPGAKEDIIVKPCPYP